MQSLRVLMLGDVANVNQIPQRFRHLFEVERFTIQFILLCSPTTNELAEYLENICPIVLCAHKKPIHLEFGEHSFVLLPKNYCPAYEAITAPPSFFEDVTILTKNKNYSTKLAETHFMLWNSLRDPKVPIGDLDNLVRIATKQNADVVVYRDDNLRRVMFQFDDYFFVNPGIATGTKAAFTIAEIVEGEDQLCFYEYYTNNGDAISVSSMKFSL
jgi:hypothetical protein